jgi:hypothetical protein
MRESSNKIESQIFRCFALDILLYLGVQSLVVAVVVVVVVVVDYLTHLQLLQTRSTKMPPIRSKRIPPPKAYKKAINEIAIYIASKPSLLQKIRDNKIDSLVSSIRREFCNVADGVNDGIFNDLAAFLNHPKQMKEPNSHAELRESMKQRKEEKERIKRIEALFVEECNLKEDDARRDKYLEQFTIVEVTRYQTPYPPPSNWVYESEQIHDTWHDHLQLGKPKDKRLKVPPMLLLETQYLQLDVDEDQNYFCRFQNQRDCWVSC